LRWWWTLQRWKVVVKAVIEVVAVVVEDNTEMVLVVV
jgi:hypothetical protein